MLYGYVSWTQYSDTSALLGLSVLFNRVERSNVRARWREEEGGAIRRVTSFLDHSGGLYSAETGGGTGSSLIT